ncbi:MAG: hypothetical protein OXH73_11645 [Caldilineaceae bacterium]|nr:hypothetical protein [Caldilineaceae bacterium]
MATFVQRMGIDVNTYRRHLTSAMKKAFISFDFDHDEELRDTLIGQAKKSDSPFNIADWSVHERINSRWRKKVRSLI